MTSLFDEVFLGEDETITVTNTSQGLTCSYRKVSQQVYIKIYCIAVN